MELQHELGPKGLVVLGLSDEPEELVAKYVEDLGIQDIRIGSGSNAATAYNVRALPSAVLIDPEGNVFWRGDPRGLSAGKVKEALRGAKPLPENAFLAVPLTQPFGKRLDAAAEDAREGRLKAALKPVRKMQADAQLEPEYREQAAQLATAIEEHVTLVLGQVEQLVRQRKVGRALEVLEAMEDELKADALGKTVQQRLGEIREDDGLMREVAAEEALEKAMAILKKRGREKSRRQFEGVVEKFAGTRAAEHAARFLR